MEPGEEFSLEGLDELDTQIILYQMGVESFSPYASSGKVDMVIRSENGDLVRYADIKVCSPHKTEVDVTWELEISFFMSNESFIILAIRLPDEEGSMQKHHFVISSTEFLSLTKKHKMEIKEDKWILSLPIEDMELIKKGVKAKYTNKISKALMPFFDNWDLLLDWRVSK
ncbi:MAG: hypothetical protein EAX86_07150 [Candidatus Heimdallarchaeota archaeon]|nr:hypothetical protein [Candidatus Heimdallarchaeota archaeon]